jgi:hypothetical protein
MTSLVELQREAGADIVPTSLALRAMRDSGYRNSAYALAELIDNALQANARLVDVMCVEETQLIKQRHRGRITAIAVLDDGEGMDVETLRRALQFGNGSRLTDRSGIGRFGMGLPNSSISQCQRIDVWSWQAGPDNAIHSYLDVDEIDQGARDVPMPTPKPVPAEWRERSDNFEASGTLVVWSRFDEHRLTWKGGRTTLMNTETLVGRIYRKFINDGQVTIRLRVWEDDTVAFDKEARANDPLYMMSGTSTPAPFDNQPMFQRWGDLDHVIDVDYEGQTYPVHVRISWARQETVPADGSDRGRQAYGKHAAKNLGVSVVRAGRELELDSAWVNTYEPTERWWGIEVEFPPALDEVFGVTNNKQAATHFARMAEFDPKEEMLDAETDLEFQARLTDEGDPRGYLIEIQQYITKQLSRLREELKDQTKGLRSRQPRHDDPKPTVEDRASSAFKHRAEEKPTETDNQDFDESARQTLVDDLIKKRYQPEVANAIAQSVEDRGRKVFFLAEHWESSAFFKVESKPGGVTEIVFNTSHPACKELEAVLSPEFSDTDTAAALLGKLEQSSDTLKMLFAAWARCELEQMTDQNRKKYVGMRQDWGQMASTFLDPDDE